MLTEEQSANAYEQATDGCRRLDRATQDNARQWVRVKPDEETNPVAGFDWEKEPRWDEPLVTTPLPLLCSGRTDCIALVIQPLVLLSRPIGKDPVAAM